jgi:hypothetical protein
MGCIITVREPSGACRKPLNSWKSFKKPAGRNVLSPPAKQVKGMNPYSGSIGVLGIRISPYHPITPETLLSLRGIIKGNFNKTVDEPFAKWFKNWLLNYNELPRPSGRGLRCDKVFRALAQN